MGKIAKAISEDGGILVMALDATDMVREMEQIHETSAVCSAALGRLLIAASMMGSTLKGANETMTLRIDADGPAGTLIVVSDWEGNVKSYISHPIVELPLNEKGKLDVRGAVGTDGTLTVVKDLGLKEPQVGQVALVSGEVAEDITYYFAQSEQVPTACALGVLVNPDLTIKAAGGFIAQVLPGAVDADIDALEKSLSKLDPVYKMLESGKTAKEIAQLVLGDLGGEVLSEKMVSYRCDCSRERTERLLISIGKKDLTDLIETDGEADVQCDFCKKSYHFSKEDLMKLYETATRE